MKKYRFLCLFMSFVICFLSISLLYSENIYAGNSSDRWNWENVDPDKWGKGKTKDELTDEQREYRNKQLWANLGYSIVSGALNKVGVIASSALTGNPGAGAVAASSQLGDDFLQWGVRSKAIADGQTTYGEYIMHESGLDYLLDTNDPNNLPSGNIDYTYSAEFLNNLQKYIKESNESSSDIITLPVYNYADGDFIIQSYGGGISGQSAGYRKSVVNFAYSKLKYNHICWINPYYFSFDNDNSLHGNRASGNFYCFFWTEDSSSDFVYYLNSDINSYSANFPLKSASFCIKRKDGQPFKYYYTVFCTLDYCGEPVRICEETKSIVNVNSTCSFNGPVNGRVWKYPYSGLVTGQSEFGFYRSAGHMSSAMTYGPQIPSFIQTSGGSSIIYDQPTTINSGDVVTYNYETIINNIGDTTGMNPEELQHRIDEVATELGAISGNTQDIKENTELQVSWLRKIYDKLCDVYDKIGSGLSGGQIFEWEWLQVKLDAIIALLGLQTASDWLDDLTDAGGDVVDIATDIGDEIILKFPFCVPWDMMLIINALKAVPETPVFEIPFKIPSWGVDETITLDLSNFQILSSVAKWFFDILYGFAITKFTLKILQVEFVGTSG